MDELVCWLGVQLDTDAAKAQSAKPGPWHADGGSVYATHPTDEVADYSESAEHIAEHDPARVLREIDAKRRMLGRIHSHAAVMGQDEVHGDLLRLLALPYADRPGYREEWRP